MTSSSVDSRDFAMLLSPLEGAQSAAKHATMT
jgi:hypothetical protein